MTRLNMKGWSVLVVAGLLLVACGGDDAENEAATESTQAVTASSHCQAAEQFAADVEAAGSDASADEVAALSDRYQDLQAENRDLGGQDLSEADFEEVARCASLLTAANLDLP